MKNQKDHIQISELFMAQVSRDERYYGTIERLQDETGVEYVFGKIKVKNSFVCARAEHDKELGRKLDEMVRMVLGYQYIA